MESTSISSRLDDGKVGIALAASWDDEPYEIKEFNAWGYASVGSDAVVGGLKSYSRSTELKRLGLNRHIGIQAYGLLDVDHRRFLFQFQRRPGRPWN